jgi:hypothetical protein
MGLTAPDRTLKVLFIMMAAAALGLFFYSKLNLAVPVPSPGKTTPPSISFSRPFHDIRGFNYSHYNGSEKVFTIGASRFRLEKKKVGFLRVALLKEATLDNAVIDILLSDEDDDLTEKTGSILACLLMDGAFAGLNSGGTGEIFIKSAELRILSKEEVTLSTVTAEKAILRIKDKTMVFSGNVRIQSGLSRLQSEHVKIYLSTGLVEPGGDYTLEPPDMAAKAKGNFTNIFLTSMYEKVRGKP